MRALVYHGPEDLRIEDRHVPELGPGEALVRVHACGICGTDLKIARGEHRAYPEGTVRVPGHEIAGEVAGVGADVDVLREGDFVFVAPNIGCGVCAACRSGRVNLCVHPEAFGITFDGAFAEYVLVPDRAIEQGCLLPVPERWDAAAISMVEPLAAVLRGAKATDTREGDVVVICGAGPIGLLHVIVARARGAAQVIVSEPSKSRREQALTFGADVAIDPLDKDLREVVYAESNGRGADAVITATPVPAVQESALELASVGGRINFFGGLPSGKSRIQIDSNLIHYRELVVTGTTANTTEDCREALDLVLSGALDTAGLISSRYSLEEADAAFASAASGDAIKMVIEP
jgi:2-desacetyl-2-hydroxyethyl bacteriochlorophyllide A dehydrogenase